MYKLFDGSREYLPASLSDMAQILKESTAHAVDIYIDGKYYGTYFPSIDQMA